MNHAVSSPLAARAHGVSQTGIIISSVFSEIASEFNFSFDQAKKSL